MKEKKETQLGLRENWEQFTLLVLVNGFVGGMVGLERSIIPQYAHELFGMASKTAILSFIIAFGFSKAVTNYVSGKLSSRWGRKKVLLLGWCLALPIPFLLMFSPSWNWVILANVLLGVSQGFTWSSTIVMKIDLVGEKDRGFAMGLNEFAGYLAVGCVAFLSAYIASRWGVNPYPFYLGIGISVLGLLISFFLVKDTHHHVQLEKKQDNTPLLKHIFFDTSIRNRTLNAISQAGLINNLNDGMIWGLLPLLLSSLKYNTEDIGIIVSVYPIVWGIGQLFTGKLSDIYSPKWLLVIGMLMQGLAILAIPFFTDFWPLVCIMAILGIGTALVYPTFLSSIARFTHTQQRAESIGVFRLWRDLGYVFGAILSGLLADRWGIETAILFVGSLTLLSSAFLSARMKG